MPAKAKLISKLAIIVFSVLTVLINLFALAYFTSPAHAAADLVFQLSESGMERIHSLAYSPDGKFLAAGVTSGVDIFDTSTFEKVKYLETSTWARSLAFSPDGLWLAVGLYDYSIYLYRAPNFDLSFTLIGHTGWVRQVAFTPDSQSLVSISDDGRLKVWNVARADLSTSLDVGILEPRSFAISPDGRQLAIGQREGSIHLYSFPGFALEHILTGHKDWVRCLAYSPDGKLLASGAFDKQVILWDPSDGSQVQVLEGHKSSVLSLVFSPDGSVLASGSVDQTTRLWQIPGGNLVSALVGHSDFVYAVAFSPSGNFLASGSGDNTLRLWELERVLHEYDKNRVYPVGEQLPQVSSDCRECHHARGEIFPPRVIEMRCDTCHTQGAGMNWCVLFPLTPEATAAGISSKVNSKKSGFPVDGDGLAIRMASPSNGEGLFTNQEYMAPVNITGRVFADSQSLDDAVVQLEAWSGNERITDLTIPVAASGSFRFRVVINPTGSQPISGKGGDHECNVCHDDFDPMGAIPSGDVFVRVTAKTSDGRQAIDERWISVDVSGRASLTVHARDVKTGHALDGVPIRAAALIYNWRMVYATEKTGADGKAHFNLDALSENTTIYQISVPEVVLDGTLYEGVAPVEVTIPAGGTDLRDVDLFVSAKKGTLSGSILSEENETLPGALVWSVVEPGGPFFVTETDQAGFFYFADLDVTRYRLVAKGVQNGNFTTSEVNLLDDPSASVEMVLPDQIFKQLRVNDENDESLPFTWLLDEKTGKFLASNPSSGEILIGEDISAPLVGLIAAPGYYAQAYRFEPRTGVEPVKLQMKPMPGTQKIAWGSGQIVVPAQTSAQAGQNTISIARGWIWGVNKGNDLLKIHSPNGNIEIFSGEFSIEVSPSGEGWLYLYEGQASITFPGDSHMVSLESNQMLALVESGQPIPMNAELAAGLRMETRMTPEIQFEPSVLASVQNSLIHLGVGTAQTVTLVAYILVLLLLLGLPVFGIYLIFRRKSKDRINDHQLENL